MGTRSRAFYPLTFPLTVGIPAPSWRRCIAEHRLDANVASAPNVLTERELVGRREAFNTIPLLAQEEIDRLYAIVRQLGYVVLLCNTEGIALTSSR